MALSLALAMLALRAGLALRRARRGLGARRPGARRTHLRLAKPAIALLLVGLLAGPPSAVALRGWDPFGTLHGWLGLLAAGLFAAAFVLGRRLARSAPSPASSCSRSPVANRRYHEAGSEMDPAVQEGRGRGGSRSEIERRPPSICALRQDSAQVISRWQCR
jgi:hypothetical protein